MYTPNGFGQIAAQRPAYFNNVSYLARYLGADIGGPILILCMTKANTRGVAGAIAQAVQPKFDVSPERNAIVTYIDQAAPYLQSLKEMVLRGVAYHNSNIPPRLRGLIEAAIRARSIDFVAATTTLAEGVDLPFRVSVLADWLIGFKEHERPISPLLFRNIAGRCGRAGEFPEGDTIIFDNVLGAQRLTQDGIRERAIASLLSDPPPLRSAAFDERQSSDDQERSVAAVASQFLASVPEFPNEDNLAKVFSLALYASHSGQKAASDRLMSDVRATLLDSSKGEPLAVAASPMKLTAFGAAANKSGLSPETCRSLRSFLQSSLPPNVDFWGFCAFVLLGLGTVIEQQNVFLRQLAAGITPKRFFVTPTDLPLVIQGYFENVPLAVLFASLEKAKRSKSKVTARQFADGAESSDFMEDMYDKFVDFVEYSFGNFLPWILRSCDLIAPFGAVWAQSYNWRATANSLSEMRTVDRTVQDEHLIGLLDQ
ncbi:MULTISPECIES: hypothetical protein [unclassified Bradyrhizobium]|uniref:hypothetical protein n=1 Tax=unclassified Bradyrhizobium TaxID=2631580 RepID=UPI0028EB0B31|nr:MULTISPECIES: hypothetical protein [unclassified Bradyrhizobium]